MFQNTHSNYLDLVGDHGAAFPIVGIGNQIDEYLPLTSWAPQPCTCAQMFQFWPNYFALKNPGDG
jgi:hypothetical protein